MGLRNVTRIDGSPVWTQLFDKNGVHLTEPTGNFFVEAIIANAEAVFKEEVIKLENESKMETGEPANSMNKA